MMSNSYLIDVHAHLHDEKFIGEHEAIVENALKAGVKKIINAGTCIETSKEAIDLADRFEACLATVGIHPHDIASFNDESIAHLTELAKHPQVLAIGEIGLDYYYDFTPRDIQEKFFVELWNLAVNIELPVVVHVRDAYDRFIPIIKELPRPKGVLLHCFSGDKKIAEQMADLGFHFSVGGALTFPKSETAREVFSYLPAELIHLETDSPYLAPQPRRGRRNEPAYVPFTFEFLAQLRKTDQESLKRQLVENARILFGSEHF